jgi:hypothetical protein
MDLGWLGSTGSGMDHTVMTEYGPINLGKAKTLSEVGELGLIPLKTGIMGMREIRFNTLLYDTLTEHGFRLNLLTGNYETVL